MKPSFYAVLFLSQFLATIVRVTFAQDSNCACDNIDSVEEIFFVPEENTPLDQDCLNVITEPALQDVHDLAEPSGTAFTRFLLNKSNCDDPNEDFVCELTDVAGSQLDTFHEETNFYYFVNVDGIAGECYSPQTYHYHKVTCSGAWIINLCVSNTMDLPASEQGCIDEIRIGQPPIQTTLCGRAEDSQCLVGLQGGSINPLNGQQELMGLGDFVMTSGTSQCCGGCGYRFSVTCLDPAQFGRKRRSSSLETNIEQKMKKHFPPFTRSAQFEVRNILVQNGVYIDYIGSTILVFNSQRVLHKFEGIREFQVYDVLTGFSTFYPSTKRITFEGYGFLMIGCEVAQYKYERVPPDLRLSEQDIEDIQSFVPLIHEGLFNQTNHPNSTVEVNLSDDRGSDDRLPGKNYGSKPGKGSKTGSKSGKGSKTGSKGEPSRDRRSTTGLADLDGQCDPMCPNQTSSEFNSCARATFESQGQQRRQARQSGHQDLQRTFYRAIEIVKSPDPNPFVERYARAFIFFYNEVYHKYPKKSTK